MESSKKISKSLALVIVAVALIASICTSFVAGNIIAENAVSKKLDENMSVAVQAIDDFSYSVAGKNTAFTDELFSKANVVATYTDEKTSTEDLEKLARYLYIDSIQITDTEGKVVASYPADLKGKDIKDNAETKEFTKVLSGFSFKKQSPAKAVDGGYSLYTCVGRPEGKGAVIISSTEKGYGELKGESIADECNDNTIIVTGDMIVSSSFAESDTTALNEKITEDMISAGEFTLDVNGNSYLCKAQKQGDFTAICAVPQSDFISKNITVVAIALGANAVVLVIAFVVFTIVGKKNS